MPGIQWRRWTRLSAVHVEVVTIRGMARGVVPCNEILSTTVSADQIDVIFLENFTIALKSKAI